MKRLEFALVEVNKLESSRNVCSEECLPIANVGTNTVKCEAVTTVIKPCIEVQYIGEFKLHVYGKRHYVRFNLRNSRNKK